MTIIMEYDVNDKRKPFTTFASAMQAIGYSPTSVAGRRTIDTGKAVGGRYTFYSFPKSLGVKYL